MDFLWLLLCWREKVGPILGSGTQQPVDWEHPLFGAPCLPASPALVVCSRAQLAPLRDQLTSQVPLLRVHPWGPKESSKGQSHLDGPLCWEAEGVGGSPQGPAGLEQ